MTTTTTITTEWAICQTKHNALQEALLAVRRGCEVYVEEREKCWTVEMWKHENDQTERGVE